MRRSGYRRRPARREGLSDHVRAPLYAVLIVFTFLGFVVIGRLSGGGRRSSLRHAGRSHAQERATPATLEYQLAALDSDGVAPGRAAERRIGRLLDRVESMVTESRQQIADMTVRANQMLAARGLRSSNAELLSSALKALSVFGPDYLPQSYAEICAILVRLSED